ncbi:MAG: CocE/NonD family hydrolase, partial [Saprospiraceae bacterium]
MKITTRFCILLSLLFFFSIWLPAQDSFNPEPGSQPWLKERLDKKEVYIQMRDGVKLFTSIYTPKNAAANYPIIMIRTPYNIESTGPEGYSRYLQGNVQLIEEGYIFAFQDVRGKYMSEGEYMDIRPFNPDKHNSKDIDESSDTYDAIDWLVKNVPHNNGRVGIFGISYPGFYSTMSLIEAHPALKAVSPQAPVTNWFIGDDFHHNGAFFIMDAFAFYSSFGRPRPVPTRTDLPGFDFPSEDNYDFFLRLGPVKNTQKVCFGDTIKFWNDLLSHPDYDDFWKARNPLPHLKNTTPAVLTVGGWFDAEDCWGPQHLYAAIERQNPANISNRVMIGPWYHGQWARDNGLHLGNIYWGSETAKKYKEAELQFFNYYLKDKGQMTLPEASIFVTGANEWRSFDQWPPQNAVEKTLYFHNNGKLDFSAPTTTGGFDEYVSNPLKPVPYTEDVHLERTREYMTDDQRFAARRPDVMVYETDLLPEDMTLTGPVWADLIVSTTGTDADYVVKLIDVFPDTAPDNMP